MIWLLALCVAEAEPTTEAIFICEIGIVGACLMHGRHSKSLCL